MYRELSLDRAFKHFIAKVPLFVLLGGSQR